MQFSLLLLLIWASTSVGAKNGGVRRQLNPHSLMIEEEYLRLKQEEKKRHKIETNSTETKEKKTKRYNNTDYETTGKNEKGLKKEKPKSEKEKEVTKKAKSLDGKDQSKIKNKCKKKKPKGSKVKGSKSGKGSKSKTEKDTSSSESKKGKGSKGKDSKGSYDDDYYDDCEDFETLTPSSDVPTDAPLPPTPEPVATIPPNPDAIVVVLSAYSLFYDIQQTRIPTLSDYTELGVFTSGYLNQYFGVMFTGVIGVGYLRSTTKVSTSEFRLGQPVRVDYNTSVFFSPNSTVIPEVAELDVLLAGAFEGTNGEAYTSGVVTNLDPSNIFATTSTVTYEQGLARSKSRFKTSFALYAINSVFVIAVVAALYRRRQEKAEYKEPNLMDHMTAAENSFTDSHTYELDDLPVKKRYRNKRECAMEWGNSSISVSRYNTAAFHLSSLDDDSNSDEDSDDATLETAIESRKRLDEISF